MKRISLFWPAALIVGSLAYGAGAIAGTYGGTFGNGGTASASSGGSDPAIGGPITSGTAGSVLFVDPAQIFAQDNANFFWDNSNNRLGIGTTTPITNLEVLQAQNNETAVYVTNTNNGTNTYSAFVAQGPTGTEYMSMGYAPSSNTGQGGILADKAYFVAGSGTTGMVLSTGNVNVPITVVMPDGSNFDEILRMRATEGVVVNDTGLSDVDFRVEGDTDTHLLFADTSADFVGIKDSTPDAVLDVGGTLRVDGQATFVADPAATGASNASVYINPATSAANEMYLACADNGTAVFSVDKEGDVDLRTVANSASGTCFTGQTGVVCVTDNMAVSPTSGGGVIALRNNSTADVEGFSFYDNSLTNLGGPRYYGSTVADADFTDKMAWVSVGKMISMLRTEAVAAGTVVFEVRDDALSTGAQLFTVDGSGNLFVNAAGTRTKGTITLAAGTGTVTVASGSICVCSDTTAVNAVQCSVSSTTLTANGTGTDVISYICL